MMLKFKNFRSKIQEASLKFIIPEDIPVKERNAFMGAAAAAHKAGKSHFDFGGKKHKVTMQGSTAKAINSGVTEGAKPDFLDLDKDGDKKETMKKAAKDAKKKKEEKPELKMNPKQDEVDEAKSDLDKRAAKLMNTGYPYGPYRKPKPKKLKPDSAMMSNVKSILRHPKAGGNTSWAAKQIAMTHGRKALKHPSIDRALRKHAETNEAIKYTHAVVDGTGKVAGMTSLGKERDAKDIARRHKGKVIKLKKPMSSKKGDMMINRPFKESIGKTPGDRSYYNLQKAKELARKAGHDYDKLPQYDRRHNDHKDYFDNKAKKVKNESKLNELSPKTLSNYARGAAMDMGTKNYVRGFEKGQAMMGMKRKEDPKDKKKAQNRLTGIITATDKLRRKTNEDQHDDDGANHIVMQLRKAVTLRGMRPVTFKDGKKVKVDPSHAQKFLTKYNKAKPMDKEKMQAMAHKSHAHFKKSLDEAVPAIAARAAIGGARAIGGLAKKAAGSAVKRTALSIAKPVIGTAIAKPIAKMAMAKSLAKKKDENVDEGVLGGIAKAAGYASGVLPAYHAARLAGKGIGKMANAALRVKKSDGTRGAIRGTKAASLQKAQRKTAYYKKQDKLNKDLDQAKRDKQSAKSDFRQSKPSLGQRIGGVFASKQPTNEISMDKLNRYVNKASSQLYHLGKQQGKQDMQPGYAPPKNRFGLSDTEKKGSKRIAGIMHATSKMVDKAKKKK